MNDIYRNQKIKEHNEILEEIGRETLDDTQNTLDSPKIEAYASTEAL